MSKWFYYNENGDKIEVTGGQLKGLAKAGLIMPDTIVETEEGKKAPARRVKGLTFAETASPEPVQESPSESFNLSNAFNTAMTDAMGGDSVLANTPSQFQFTAEEQAEIDRFIAKNGSDVKAVDQNGNTLLYLAVMYRGMKLNSAYYPDYETDGVIKYLISQGADVNAKCMNGQTPLHCIGKAPIETAKLLVSQGADVNIKDKNGKNALFSAVTSGNVEVVKFFIFQGADVNAGDVVVDAVMTGKPEILKILVSAGTSVGWRNEKGATLVDIAGHLERMAIAESATKAESKVFAERLTAIVQYLSSLPNTPWSKTSSPLSAPAQASEPVATDFWTLMTTKTVTLAQSRQKSGILWGTFWGCFAFAALIAWSSIANSDAFVYSDRAVFSFEIAVFISILSALPMVIFFIWACVESGAQGAACPKCERMDADQVIREETLEKRKIMETRTNTETIRHASGKCSYIDRKYEVPVTEHTIRRTHQCMFCQHVWTDTVRRTTDGWES